MKLLAQAVQQQSLPRLQRLDLPGFELISTSRLLPSSPPLSKADWSQLVVLDVSQNQLGSNDFEEYENDDGLGTTAVVALAASLGPALVLANMHIGEPAVYALFQGQLAGLRHLDIDSNHLPAVEPPRGANGERCQISFRPA